MLLLPLTGLPGVHPIALTAEERGAVCTSSRISHNEGGYRGGQGHVRKRYRIEIDTFNIPNASRGVTGHVVLFPNFKAS